jgi:non-canonical purine NTP pyrophosphatase (RdgB/HAM1 family)
MNLVFVTGNPNKARLFSELVGRDIEHHPADTDEIQSLDLAEIVEHKAKAAYAQLKKPVIVEDTRYTIVSLGKLPGPLVKWFEQELGLERICRLADIDENRSAVAGAAFAYYDGANLEVIESQLTGKVPAQPKGPGGFGWNPIFIPDGQELTMAEMDEETFKKFYIQVKPFGRLREYLMSLDNEK